MMNNQESVKEILELAQELAGEVLSYDVAPHRALLLSEKIYEKLREAGLMKETNHPFLVSGYREEL